MNKLYTEEQLKQAAQDVVKRLAGLRSKIKSLEAKNNPLHFL